MAKFKVGDTAKYIDHKYNIIIEIIGIDQFSYEYKIIDHHTKMYIGYQTTSPIVSTDKVYDLYTRTILGKSVASPKFKAGAVIIDKTLKDPILQIQSVDTTTNKYKGVIIGSTNPGVIGSSFNDDISFVDQFYDYHVPQQSQQVNVPAGQGLQTPVSSKPRFQKGDQVQIAGETYTIISVGNLDYQVIDSLKKNGSVQINIADTLGILIKPSADTSMNNTVCKCDMYTLMNKGCNCGAIQKYKPKVG